VNVGETVNLEEIEISRWWEGFGDTVTTDLVRAALQNNNDLKGAAARVMEAEAIYRTARGRRLPEVSYGLSGSRNKSSFVLPQTGRVGIWSTTFSHNFTASYQIDLFRQLSRSQRAAWAELLAADADREALIHTVIASVVRSRVRLATLKEELSMTKSNTESWEKTFFLIDMRYARGLSTSLEVRLAKENLEASRVNETVFEELYLLAYHGLDTLLGRRPGTGPPLPETMRLLPDPDPVPVGLPAALLDRRPDVKGAELRLLSATEQVGIAMADLFPSLSLTGSSGITSDDLKGLTSTDGLVYSAVANLLAPIFTGGRLKAQVSAAKARREQATASYAGTVLVALREVEDALVREEITRRRYRHLESRLEEARAAERLARDRYRRGVEKLLTVLETERRRYIAEIELAETREAIWNARIDLLLALGGDWGTELEVPATRSMEGTQGEATTKG
jgi:NodT family efflux transporter outer membrane factor (OMF) lipoprotein